jgi:hypothetical protein
MRKRKRTIVTVEVEQALFVKGRPLPARVWCAACAAEVPAVAPEAAAAMTSNTARTVYRWVEGGKVHFKETPAGELRLCLPSLLVFAFGAEAPGGDGPDVTDPADTPAKT